MGQIINMRRQMGKKDITKPYDAEIEYLRGNGTQYIDSGIECTGDLSVNFKARWSKDENKPLAGGIYNYGSTLFRNHFTPLSAGEFYWLQNNSSNTAIVRFTSSLNTWYTAKIDASNGTYNINGTTGTFTPLPGSVTAHANYGIFGRLSGNVATQIRSGNNDFAYIQLSRNGVLLRDYIPVRIGTTGYMYDKVSGQLFGNAGTGEFSLGPDKV